MELAALLIALALVVGFIVGSLWRDHRLASDHRARESVLNARIEAADQRATRSDATAEDAMHKAETAQESLLRYRAQHETLVADHATLREDHDAALAKIAGLEAKLVAANAERDSAYRRAEKLARDMGSGIGEAQAARSAAAAAGRRIAELNAEIEALRTKASRLQTDLASARAATAEVERDAEAENARLAAELSNARWELRAVGDDEDGAAQDRVGETARLNRELRESRAQIHALRNQLAEHEALRLIHGAAGTSSGAADEQGGNDLEQIKGIGPLFRARLNEIGVTTFLEIAMWNDQEAAKMSEVLDTLPDRVIREQWREQAARLHAAIAEHN